MPAADVSPAQEVGRVRIRVIEPCGPPDSGVLNTNLAQLREAGLQVDYEPSNQSTGERLSVGGVATRFAHFNTGLSGHDYDYLLCVRGGYGASELLGLVDWTALADVAPRPLIGFSDVSALQSAFYTRLHWPALHAPMPGSPLWGDGADIEQLMTLLCSGQVWQGTVSVNGHGGEVDSSYSGRLFGGCLSVLTNLIGTAYLPNGFAGHILFFEDSGESPPRLLRCWRQWLDCGLLEDVRAVVFGRFTDIGPGQEDEEWVQNEMAARSPCPVFFSSEFGHVSPNMPLCLGAQAVITDGKLHWHLAR